jgi:hypothetical protein
MSDKEQATRAYLAMRLLLSLPLQDELHSPGGLVGQIERLCVDAALSRLDAAEVDRVVRRGYEVFTGLELS